VSQGLAELARLFQDSGYVFFLTGESARQFYLGRREPPFRAWTNADLIFLSRLFDAVHYPEDSSWSAEVSLDAGPLRIACEPLWHPGGKQPLMIRLQQISNREFFTVHGLLYDPGRSRFIDPSGCLMDVRSGLLRALAPPPEHPSSRIRRLFAAVYLECEERLDPQPELLEELATQPPSTDREWLPLIREGLAAILTSRQPYLGLQRLHSLGALLAMLPELAPLKGCPQDKEYHPEGDVFDHTLECFRRCRRLPLATALGLLLHDIGKPVTLSAGKTVSFPRHATVGAAMAGRLLRRLGFPRELAEEVRFYISHHLLRQFLERCSAEEGEALIRHRWFENLLRIYRADIQGSSGDLSRYRDLVRRIEAVYGLPEQPRPGTAPGRGRTCEDSDNNLFD